MQHGAALARNAFAVALQADADGLRFVGGESFEGVAADELAAAEIYGEVEAGLNRIDGFGEFVAVERHRGFEAESVASAETGSHAADAFAACSMMRSQILVQRLRPRK